MGASRTEPGIGLIVGGPDQADVAAMVDELCDVNRKSRPGVMVYAWREYSEMSSRFLLSQVEHEIHFVSHDSPDIIEKKIHCHWESGVIH